MNIDTRIAQIECLVRQPMNDIARATVTHLVDELPELRRAVLLSEMRMTDDSFGLPEGWRDALERILA